MTIKAGYCTPLLHAQDIEASIVFYERLGFERIDVDDHRPPGWARLHCEGGALMFLQAEEPFPETHHGFLFCMYSPDLAGLREQLLAAGVTVSPIKYPEYMPSGEITLKDPDGNTVFVSHWGKAEQEAWEKRIGRKA